VPNPFSSNRKQISWKESPISLRKKLVPSGLPEGIFCLNLAELEIRRTLLFAFATSTRLFKLAESRGGVKGLLCHPASMTHKSIPREKRLSTGVRDSLIRLRH